MITSEDIKRRLWAGANSLRGSMDASRYKDYMLGLMFYKFLSDRTLEAYRKMDNVQGNEFDLYKEYEQAYEQYGEDLVEHIRRMLGYYVLPQYLYQRWLLDIREGTFELQKVIDSLQTFERTVATSQASDDLEGL